MIVLDANVWVSILRRHEPNHAESVQWIRHLQKVGGEIAVPTLFLVEIAAAVNRRTGVPDDARRAVSYILRNRRFHMFEIDQPLAETASYLAIDLNLRGADAIYVALARREAYPLITWDREILNRGTRLISVLTPKEALQLGIT